MHVGTQAPTGRGQRGALAFGVLIALISFVPVAAQNIASGTIQGTVRDETGGALPGVTVTLSSPALQVKQLSEVTGADGAYAFRELPAGLYRVQYELSGFSTTVRDEVRLNVGFAARLDATMKVGTLEETVTVSGQSPVVDVTNTTTSVNLTKEVLDSVPRGRGLWDSLTMAPGVTTAGAPDVGDSNLANRQNIGNYGTFAQPKLEVEGINIQTGDQLSSAVYFDYFVFEEVQVKASGNDAEVSVPGVSLVGIVKSGGNQFHGAYAGAYQSSATQSNNVDDELRAQGIQGAVPLDYYYDIAGDLGGRLIPDKLWFYGALSRQSRVTQLPGFVASPGPDGRWLTQDDVPAEYGSRLDTAAMKLSYQLSPNNKLIGVWMPSLKVQPAHSAARLRTFESSRTYRQPNGIYKGEIQSMLSDKVLLNVVGGWGGYFADYQLKDDVAGNPSSLDRETGLRTGPHELPDQRPRDRWQSDGGISFFPDRFLGGKHDLKAGYSLYWEHAATGYNEKASGPYYLVFDRVGGVSNTPAEIVTYNFPLEPDNRASIAALYLKDSWRVNSRVTANLGVRWEQQKSFLPEQTKQQGIFGTSGTFPERDVFTWTRVVPRLGLAWDVSGDGKTVVKATYGWYNHAAGDDFAQLYNGNALVTTTYRWRDLDGNRDYTPGEVNLDLNGPDFINITGASNNLLNPDLKQPITYETTASVERELGNNLGLRAIYVYKRQKDYYDTPGPNVLRPFGAYNIPITRRDPGPDGLLGSGDDGTPVTFYDYAASYRGAAFVGNMVVNSPNEDKYHSVEATLTKRFSQKWSALASGWMTRNHRWVTKTFQSPNDEFHPLDETWAWASTLSATYRMPWDIQVSTFFQAKSGVRGQRTYVFRSSDPDGGRPISQLSTVTLRLEPYGARKERPINVMNVRGLKRVQLGGKSIELHVDLFNALNANSPTAMNYVSGPTFGYVTDILEPRILRVGARLNF